MTRRFDMVDILNRAFWLRENEHFPLLPKRSGIYPYSRHGAHITSRSMMYSNRSAPIVCGCRTADMLV